MTATSSPDMSVVLITRGSVRAIRKTIQHLLRQTVIDRLELLIVAPSRATLDLADADVQGFHSVQVIELGPIVSMSAARTAATRQATGPVVAFGEDHCYPDPEWAEYLIKAHGEKCAAAGPTMRNANPRSMTSWVSYLMSFSRWNTPVAGGATDGLPWHNTSYRRELLLAFGDQLPALFTVEGFLQERLVAQGYQLTLAPLAKVQHVNVSLPSCTFQHALLGGRLFGASRVRNGHWTLSRRCMYILAAPLVPAVRLLRTCRDIRRIGEQERLLPRILPILCIALSCHALGELLGYAFGPGNGEQRYSIYELSRIDQITEEDRQVELAG
jgi:hypothetical protein